MKQNLTSLLSIACAGFMSCAQAQTEVYPVRLSRLTVPFSPGSNTNIKNDIAKWAHVVRAVKITPE